MSYSLTTEEAIALAETGWWKDCPPEAIALFQLNEDKLCLDFSAFHEATEKATGRSVWTHEFVRPEILIKEIEARMNGAPPAEADPLGSLLAIMGEKS